jgi:hypothetical protein
MDESAAMVIFFDLRKEAAEKAEKEAADGNPQGV